MNARHASAMRLGVDIGGTKTLGVAVGEGGELLAEALTPSGFGPDGVLDALGGVVARLRERLPGREIARIGIGIPGAVDPATGDVRQALNLGIERFALGPLLADRLGVPVHVENDVNVAALGASTLGAGGSLAYLNLGTGLAVGLVIDGELWRGASGAAGEIGHIPIDPAGPECVCGLRGCLELYASGSGLARQWGEDVPMIAAVEALAAEGDPRAVTILRGLLGAVAAAVRIVALGYDVERIVLGGGIASALGPRLLGPVRETLRGWEAGSAFLASLAPSSRVELAPAAPIGALGAALAGLPVAAATDAQLVPEAAHG